MVQTKTISQVRQNNYFVKLNWKLLICSMKIQLTLIYFFDYVKFKKLVH